MLDKYAIYALAINALAETGDSCDTDIRWPETEALCAIGWSSEVNDAISPSVVFGLAYRLGLVIGATLARNPLERPDLGEVVQHFKDELVVEFRTTDEEKAGIFLSKLGIS